MKTRLYLTDPESSARMRRIRQKRTAAELELGQLLRDIGIRGRQNVRSLPGSPDFANISKRWAIFTHGCFWHHHRGCSKATLPKQNRSFWKKKFAANRLRDSRKAAALRRLGFRVLTVWECELRRPNVRKRITRFARSL
jgi:DNA mismatch endonuclease, patch repair protein